MTESLSSQLLSNIAALANARGLELIGPRFTMIQVNQCMFCYKVFPECAIHQVGSHFIFDDGRLGMIFCCEKHIPDAKLSMIKDCINELVYPLHGRPSEYYKTNHGPARVHVIRLSKSAYPGKPVIQMFSPSESALFYRTYSQFLEMNTEEDLRKLLDVDIPEDYPQELVDIFKTI